MPDRRLRAVGARGAGGRLVTDPVASVRFDGGEVSPWVKGGLVPTAMRSLIGFARISQPGEACIRFAPKIGHQPNGRSTSGWKAAERLKPSRRSTREPSTDDLIVMRPK